jgi:hypothetical protein
VSQLDQCDTIVLKRGGTTSSRAEQQAPSGVHALTPYSPRTWVQLRRSPSLSYCLPSTIDPAIEIARIQALVMDGTPPLDRATFAMRYHG